MFSKIRTRVSYANVALALALVFAMTGGAYAASKYVITSTKQISPKALNELAAKVEKKSVTGPAGPTGQAGPTGSIGPEGKEGKEGKQGPAGTAGKDGAAGPAGPQGPAGPEGEEGTDGKAGATGPAGPAGPPGPEGNISETLLSKKSETGVWAISGLPFKVPTGGEFALATIPFTIPLKQAVEASYIGYEEGEGESKENLPIENGVKLCKGTYAKPEAAPGHLCIFVGENEPVNTGFVFPVSIENSSAFQAGKTGAVIEMIPGTPGEGIFADGSWVVTAP